MIEITKYQAFDGITFDTMDECLEHERRTGRYATADSRWQNEGGTLLDVAYWLAEYDKMSDWELLVQVNKTTKFRAPILQGSNHQVYAVERINTNGKLVVVGQPPGMPPYRKAHTLQAVIDFVRYTTNSRREG